VDWTGIRERVVAVAQAEDRAAGRQSIRPVFEPALSADEIAEVEAQYGVALPGEYRSFLAEVAAGGPGPELWLTSLCRVEGRWVWKWGNYPQVLDASGPFVETEDWPAQQVRTLRAAGHEPAVRHDDHDFLKDYEQAFGPDADEAWYLERVRGAIQISDDGCGMTNYLIVVGPHRGELRFRDCALNPPFKPIVDGRGNRHTFYTWYIDWLERREAKAAIRAKTPYPPVQWVESATRPGVYQQVRPAD
jgi:hypothetical protein